MRGVLKMKVKAMQLVKSVSEAMKGVIDDALVNMEEIITNHMQFNVNTVENAGLALVFKAMVLSEDI